VPVQAPRSAERVWPSRPVPEIAGAVVFTGAVGAMRAVVAVVAGVLPAAFVAVTTARMVEPASAEVSAYVTPVAPAMSAQLAPLGSQRRHW